MLFAFSLCVQVSTLHVSLSQLGSEVVALSSPTAKRNNAVSPGYGRAALGKSLDTGQQGNGGGGGRGAAGEGSPSLAPSSNIHSLINITGNPKHRGIVFVNEAEFSKCEVCWSNLAIL